MGTLTHILSVFLGPEECTHSLCVCRGHVVLTRLATCCQLGSSTRDIMPRSRSCTLNYSFGYLRSHAERLNKSAPPSFRLTDSNQSVLCLRCRFVCAPSSFYAVRSLFACFSIALYVCSIHLLCVFSIHLPCIFCPTCVALAFDPPTSACVCMCLYIDLREPLPPW